MGVLTYSSAKRSLIMTAVYLICASLIIKGIGHLLEYNLITGLETMLSGHQFNFEIPKFNMDNLSFDLLATFVKDKIDGIIEVIFGSALGVVNYAHFSSAAAGKAVATGAAKVATYKAA
ncbi:hypothetical protein ACQRXC_29420 (plasmid) [Niallia taxi]|uniref:hypothetical protein n=1 Tax=Niallia taxi TaxID=2499688 RepID=UPI003F5F62FE